jgi:RNA polymerase sigma-54 factor
MAVEPRLGLQVKLSQKLVLTPQIHQAIKLLQMSQLELSQTINQELVENPFLEEEVVELTQDDRKDTLDNEDKSDSYTNEETDLTQSFENMFGFNNDDYFQERGSDGRDLGYFNPGTEEQPIFEQASYIRSDIYDHLIWQLRLSSAPELIRLVAEIIIGNLDDNGYLKISLDEITSIAGVTTGDTLEALTLVQSFDPPGVGARDLKECLLLQLIELDKDSSLAQKIVNDSLEELKEKDYEELAAKYDTTVNEVNEAVKIISSLEPRPGRNYTSETATYITPDVYIVESDGEFKIVLNDESMPRLRLSSYYRSLLANKDKLLKEDKEFLIEKLKSAKWLLKALDQRNKTIYKVTESVIKFQEDFFRYGVKGLKPLNLKDVANELGMHESTISRVTSNKYLLCSHGILSFRYFFGSAIQSSFGEVSSASVKEMIQKLVSEESQDNPLSDGKIVDILKMKNIKIARRTVAKYREELRIPPMSKRKGTKSVLRNKKKP